MVVPLERGTTGGPRITLEGRRMLRRSCAFYDLPGTLPPLRVVSDPTTFEDRWPDGVVVVLVVGPSESRDQQNPSPSVGFGQAQLAGQLFKRSA